MSINSIGVELNVFKQLQQKTENANRKLKGMIMTRINFGEWSSSVGGVHLKITPRERERETLRYTASQ